MTSAWLTDIDLSAIAERLRAANSVTLLTHEKPDGDAVGSTVALALALNRIDVSATVAYAGAWTDRFNAIAAGATVIKLGDQPDLSKLPENPDVVVITDTGSWSQLSLVREWLEPRTDRAIVIDHHLHGDAGTAAHRHIDTDAAAVCETVAELCRTVLCLDHARELPRDIADALYLGLATDTGWFRHSNVTPDTLRLAAALLEAGADHAKLFRTTEQQDKPGRLRLFARALSSMELHHDNAIALITLTHDDLHTSGAEMNDAGGLTDMLLTIAQVRVGVSLTEVGEARTKISFRSKTGDGAVRTVDVNKAARTLGGGGHAQAAGARLDLPVAEAKARVLDALKGALS